MLKAIVRATSPALARCTLTYLSREAIDVGTAMAQHCSYVDALRDARVVVETLPAEPDVPDAVFVEDTAVVLNEIGVVARPGATSRRQETQSVARILAAHRPLEHIQAPATLEGGDVLRVGSRIFVGLSRRTNAAGAQQLARIVAKFGYEVTPVPVDGCLHLKTGVSYVGRNTVLLNPAWVDSSCFRHYEQIAVPQDEPFAANCLLVYETVFVSRRSRKTRRLAGTSRSSDTLPGDRRV